ncbi:proline-rich receptor-like protein kinase PERK2 [Iris pallida]|uniref:Proline-rich receptor-like protein kinase PERK2 n=1 Tax=Iris pallida TaxID=29817 RepID=A0AAX6HL87_IRIPA|nr:proline-rich receptor-like protein kinase PERK2 [Iris pallida]
MAEEAGNSTATSSRRGADGEGFTTGVLREPPSTGSRRSGAARSSTGRRRIPWGRRSSGEAREGFLTEVHTAGAGWLVQKDPQLCSSPAEPDVTGARACGKGGFPTELHQRRELDARLALPSGRRESGARRRLGGSESSPSPEGRRWMGSGLESRISVEAQRSARHGKRLGSGVSDSGRGGWLRPRCWRCSHSAPIRWGRRVWARHHSPPARIWATVRDRGNVSDVWPRR